jgi:hypothetical protein
MNELLSKKPRSRRGELRRPKTSVVVRSFEELHGALEIFRSNPVCLFRGQGNAAWKLVPKAGRPPFDRYEYECLVADWKQQAIQHLEEKPKTELEWYALAQHHGLATCFLDWTLNPLVAAFFAVWEDIDVDAAIYAFTTAEIVSSDFQWNSMDRADEPNVFAWIPNPISPRIGRQQGAFTIHEPAAEPLYWLKDFEELFCIRIQRSYRNKLREELAWYGLNRASMFPDLDGLSLHLNWTVHQLPLRRT